VNWSRAVAGSPAIPVKRARFSRAVRVSGCVDPDTSDGEQFRVLVAGRGWVTRHTGEAGEIRPGAEGGGVRGSKRLIESGSPALPTFHFIHRPREGSPREAVDHIGGGAPGPQVLGFGT
jgi:hypothetical protein